MRLLWLYQGELSLFQWNQIPIIKSYPKIHFPRFWWFFYMCTKFLGTFFFGKLRDTGIGWYKSIDWIDFYVFWWFSELLHGLTGHQKCPAKIVSATKSTATTPLSDSLPSSIPKLDSTSLNWAIFLVHFQGTVEVKHNFCPHFTRKCQTLHKSHKNSKNYWAENSDTLCQKLLDQHQLPFKKKKKKNSTCIDSTVHLTSSPNEYPEHQLPSRWTTSQ